MKHLPEKSYHRFRNTLKTFYLLTMLFLSQQLFSQNTWSQIASYAGGERERAVAFTIGERGYVCTGLDSANTCKKDLWEYDPGTNSWTQKADFPAQARRDAIAFAIGNRGYVGTGITNSVAWMGTKKKDLWEYNPLTNSWVQKADWPGNFGQGIYFASAFATSTKGYLACGKLGFSWYSNELWEYDPLSNTWDQKDNFPGGARYGAVAVSVGGKGYVGCGSDENYYRNDWWQYDPQADEWNEKADFPGSPRFNPAGIAMMGRAFVGMGTDGGCQKDFYEYNPFADEWHQKANYGGSERRSCVAFSIGNYGYVGIGDGPTGIKRSFYKYKPFFWFAPDETDQRISSTVYPNPVHADAHISFDEVEGMKVARIRVSGMNGQEVSAVDIQDGNTFHFERNNLPAGIYLYEIQIVDEHNNKISSTGKLFLL